MPAALTRDGSAWTPRYLQSIDQDACIGCGRCYKVCGHSVMEPISKPFDEEDDEFGDGFGNTVMSVARPGACIGCEACLRTCAKKAHVHVEV
jgi:Nif-specific ferredoxin III